MGYSSTFDLSMLMLAIGSSLLFIFAFILIKRVRGDAKKEREAQDQISQGQQRVDELSHAYEETVALGRRDVLLTQLLNKRIFEEDRVQLAKQAHATVRSLRSLISFFPSTSDPFQRASLRCLLCIWCFEKSVTTAHENHTEVNNR